MSGPQTAVANWQTQYYLTVSSAHGTPGGAGWYNSSTSAYASTPLLVAGATGTQYVFTGWSGDASGTTSPSNPIIMSGPMTATANWQTQYNLTFAQSGMGSDLPGTVMTVNDTVYGSTGFSAWVNTGNVYTFSYSSPLVVTANGEQYVLTGVSGNGTASVLTVSAATTVIGAYQTQYYLTTTSAYDSPSPANGWYDSGTSISAFVSSPVPGASGTQLVCMGWSGTGSVPAFGSTSAFTFTIDRLQLLLGTGSNHQYQHPHLPLPLLQLCLLRLLQLCLLRLHQLLDHRLLLQNLHLLLTTMPRISMVWLLQ